MTDDRDWITWLGLAVVGTAAAIMSFTALAELARLCGVTATITVGGLDVAVAWLLPATVDVLAAVSTRVWLQRRVGAEAVAYARRSAWSAIAATVVGNAAHGVLVQSDVDAPWWAAVLVGAVPAVALGAMVHLAVLVGRGADQAVGEPVRVDPLAGLSERLLAEPWDRAVGEWSASIARAQRPVPDWGSPDEVLAQDLVLVDADRRSEGGRELSRDGIIRRYGVGAPRAKKLREIAEKLSADQPVGAGVSA